MINLVYPAKNPYTLNVYDEAGEQVGRVYYGSTVPPLMKRKVMNNKELSLLNIVDNSRDYMQIESVEIFEVFREQGFFRDTMEGLEDFAKGLKLKAIILFDSGPLLDFYKSLGYEILGCLDSIGLHILRKEVDYTI